MDRMPSKTPEARAHDLEVRRAYERRPEVRARKYEYRRRRYAENLNGFADRDREKARIRRVTRPPEEKRDEILTRKYGISLCQWNELFLKQGSCCAICKSLSPNSIHGWDTDHDHVTGEVRGILCHQCNIAVGWFEKLKKADLSGRILDYLKK